MPNAIRRLTLSLAAAALTVPGLLLASQSARAAGLRHPVHLRFAAAHPASTWYAYAGSIRNAMLAELPKGSTIDIMNTPMSIANTKLLSLRRADVGLSFPPVVTWAAKGIGPFKHKITDIRGLVGGLDRYYQRITLQKDSKINSLAEIKAKHLAVRIATGPEGSLNEYICKLILNSYGITFADIRKWGGSVTKASLQLMKSLFQDRRVDMIIGLTTAGHPNTAQLAVAPGEKFLGLSRRSVRYLEHYGFVPATMPANLFEGQTKPIRGVGMTTSIYVRKEMPNAEAYVLAEAVMKARKTIKASFKSMASWTAARSAKEGNLGVPLHPGAAMYFRQAGLLH